MRYEEKLEAVRDAMCALKSVSKFTPCVLPCHFEHPRHFYKTLPRTDFRYSLQEVLCVGEYKGMKLATWSIRHC